MITTFYVNIFRRMDPRTKDWLLAGDPLPLFCIWMAYLASVFFGPKLMRPFKAFDLKVAIFIYNIFLVGLSAYMFYEFFMSAYLAKYSLGCQLVDYSTSPLAMRMASVCWWFFFSKVIELADTWFFILRKKDNQISFLHVYHHCTMIWIWWSGVTYVGGGLSFWNAILNCFVHTIMYLYYALSVLGPRVQKYLWWKRYLTQLQLIQFVAIFVHSIYNTLSPSCQFTKAFTAAAAIYSTSLLILFARFYFKAYRQKRLERKIMNGKAH